jgi:multiple sugar transport system substrate-binding protein
MKAFKRITAIALVALLTMALMAGCQSTNNGTEPNKISTLEEEKGKTLSILIPGHNENDESLWQNQVHKEFKEKYPDVKVEFVTADWSNWEEKLMAAYRSGDPIDLIHDGVNNNPRFPIQGITQPIEPYVDLNNPDLQKETMEACFKYEGNYYVAAAETNFGIIFFNKKMFADAGLPNPYELYEQGKWNWDNFLKYAKQMTDASKGQWGYSTEYPYLYYGSNKTSTLEVKDGKFVLNMDDPAFVASLELLQDGVLNKWSGWEGSSMASFQTGKSAMLGSFSQYEPEINSLAAIFGWDPIDYGAVPLPAGPNNPEGYNMVHASGFAIGQGSDCPAHTGKLIDMLVTGYAQMRVEERKDLPQAHKDLYAEMSKKQFCVNTRDSAVGGGYELAHAVSGGQSIAQAIEEFKPQYQRKIDEINGG